jgi:hypothetical protein
LLAICLVQDEILKTKKSISYAGENNWVVWILSHRNLLECVPGNRLHCTAFSYISTHILYQFELDVRITLSNEIGVSEVGNSIEVNTEDCHFLGDDTV